MTKIKKRIISTFAILAVSATATLGGLGAFSGSTSPMPIANADTTIVNKTPESEATKYYVGTPAEGAAGTGTTPEDPISPDQFVAKLTSLKPGVIVYIMPGTHKATITWAVGRMNDSETSGNYVNGSYDDYIIFKAYEYPENDSPAVLDFSDMTFNSTNRGVHIYGNYYYWCDIDVCGAGDNGLYIGGSYNVVENCEFYNNRDTGLQLGRNYSSNTNINNWPNYNLVKNCTSHNNYDNETYGENADGFAAKLTVGYGNIFDGCIAYRNSDDGWDLYGKDDTGIIGTVYMYNCVAFENGFLEYTQAENNAKFSKYNNDFDEANPNSYTTRDGDGNGFKLGGSTLEGDVYMSNCIAFNNRMHGITDNSNPGVISLTNVTAYNNSAVLDNMPYTTITDINGNTAALASDGKTVATYRDVNEDGYILDTSGKQIVVNESGSGNEAYASLDEEGYILDSSGNKLDANNKPITAENNNTDAQPIKGSYIMVSATVQPVSNSNYGKIASCDAEHNNIDIARSESSYNNFTGVLSVFNGRTANGNDAYIGSAEDSLLVAGNKWNKIDGTLDANTISGKAGENVNAAAASDIFAALPANNLGVNREIHIHTKYRNEDGSVKLGDLLKIKDYSLLFGDDNKIGANLVGDDTTVYASVPFTYLTDDKFTSEDAAFAQAINDMIYVPVKQDAVYQDFQLSTAMLGNVTVTWTSSDSNIINIGSESDISLSGVTHITAVVYRDIAENKTVTLKATAKIGEQEITTKEFTLTVMQNEYIVGDIVAEGVENDKYVVSQYSITEEPSIEVRNAADYNGKNIPAEAYTVETIYMYSPVKGGHMDQVSVFTTSNAGVYEITKNVTVAEDNVGSYTYTIYVVDSNAKVDFLEAPEVSVTYNGFAIKGTLNNVQGTLYAMVGEEGETPTIADFRLYGQKYDVTTDEIDAQFLADNDSEYYIYYAVVNPNGALTSPVYSTKVSVTSITTREEFAQFAQTGGNSSSIYKLEADLDFTGYSWIVGTGSFKALLDGQGHTVSNITIVDYSGENKACVFYRLDGGALMNITFKDINIEGAKRVGIFGSAMGGYVGNVKLQNVNVKGTERVGGLIGFVMEQSGMDLIIERVSIVNDANHSITSTTKYVGGIFGHMQANSAADSTYKVVVSISNCYVNSVISAPTSEAGGIVGKWDDSYSAQVTKSLTIDRCYFAGTVSTKSRCGGIIAYQTGSYPVTITNCVSFGDIYHANSAEPIAVAEKNASGIFGGYNANAPTQVLNCYAKFEEHNAAYFVTTTSATQIASASFWTDYAHFDLENVWQLVDGVLTLR